MDLFEESYYRLNKRLLFYLGQWPLQTSNERNFYRTTTALIVLSILVVEIIKFVECFGDLRAMIECLPEMGIHFRCAVRFLNCTFEATNMKKLLVQIKDDWTMKNSKSDAAILRTYAERSRKYTVGYTVYVFVITGGLFAAPFIPIVLDIVAPLNQSRNRIYLIETEYFVDQDEHYLSIMIHAYIAMVVTSGIMAAHDATYAVYVQHVCGIFAKVGARLRSIGRNPINNQLQTNENYVERTDKAYDEIGTCIRMHNEAMRLADLIESTNCVCLFVLIGTSMLMITTTGYMAATNAAQPSEAFRFVVTVVGETVVLGYLFWPGHQIMMHSENIFVDAYNVYWYDLSPQAKKLLIVIMIRSLEPCKFTAGKIVVLSMENYAAALKTSMSYFTVLLSMQ